MLQKPDLTNLELKDNDAKKQRIEIDEYLKLNHPAFRRYIHIFFHSGSRTAELMRLQGKHIDIDNQRFALTVKKGKGSAREEWRPIKNIALNFWTEAMKNCGPDDYIFSRGFSPYKSPLSDPSGYASERWRELIKWPIKKGGLGIDVDLYSLKHLNLDETAAEISQMQEGLKAAATMAGHTTPVITLRYAQGENDRQNDRLKKLGNKFA